MVYSLLFSGNFCRLLIAFANSLDPDQDLDRNCLTLIVFLKDFFKEVNFETREPSGPEVLTQVLFKAYI